MKDITSTINESSTSPREITNYVKSWITHCSFADEYESVLIAIKKGMELGCKENLKYLKDDSEQVAAKKLNDVISNWDIKLNDWD